MNPSDEFIHCAMDEENNTCKAIIKPQNFDEKRCWRPAKESSQIIEL